MVELADDADGVGEVTLQDVAGPVEILDQQRLIEAQAVAQGLDLFGRGFVAEQHVDRVARDQMDKEKDDRRRGHQGGSGRAGSLQDV